MYLILALSQQLVLLEFENIMFYIERKELKWSFPLLQNNNLFGDISL